MAQQRFPPGTVFLHEANVSRETSEVVLIPTPSGDPNDPLNWSLSRKWFNFCLASTYSLVAFSSIMIKPVLWQQMGRDMGLTPDQLANGQSANLAGLATGCLLFIPFAVKYGRRLTYILSLVVMTAVAWWTSAMHTYAESLVVSIISGLATAINETIIQMTITDLFFLHQRASANGVYFIAVTGGSFLVPMIAGVQAAAQGWRWSYYAMSIALTILLALFIFLFEETKYVPVITGQRDMPPPVPWSPGFGDDTLADEKGPLPGDDKDRRLTRVASTLDLSIPRHSYRQRMRLVTATSEPLGKLFVFPAQVLWLPHVLYTAVQYAADVCWLVLLSALTSLVFSAPPYNFNTAAVGYMNAGPVLGAVLGSLYGGVLSDRAVVWLARRNGGVFEAEMRLYMLPLPVVCLSGGLIMFGVTAARGMHWIFPSIGAAVFAFGFGAKGDTNFTLVLDTYHELAAEAFVAIAFLRNAVSIGIPASIVPWMARMGLSNMFILAGCVGLGVSLLFVPLIVWGRRMRVALERRYWGLVERSRNIRQN